MNSKTIAALTIILGIALSTTSFAQGRHDEKPHAMGKQATVENGKAAPTPTGGRHDAAGTTHGAPKVASKKDAAKPVDDKSGK
jgi:hypothetical protein